MHAQASMCLLHAGQRVYVCIIELAHQILLLLCMYVHICMLGVLPPNAYAYASGVNTALYAEG